MGTEIRYCDSCGKLISPAEVVGGRALVTPTGTVCAECLRALSPEQRAALEGQRPAGRATPGGGADGAKRRIGPGGTGGSPVVSRRSSVLPVSICVGICLGAAVALLAVKMGGTRGSNSGGPPRPLPGPVDLSPGPPPEAGPDGPVVAPHPAATSAAEPGAPRRLDEIAAMVTPGLGRYDDMVRALRSFPAEYPDAPEAAEAERLLRDLEKRYAERADAALADAVRTAADLERAGEVDAAISIVRAVRARFRGSAWASARGDAETQATLDRLLAARKERPPAVPPPAAPAVQPSPPGSMVVHWTFDDPAADVTLSIVGADAAACTTDGLAGRALALDGLDDYAITPRPLAGRLADASCTFLVRFRPEGAGVLLSELGQPVPSDGWHFTVLEISPTERSGGACGKPWAR